MTTLTAEKAKEVLDESGLAGLVKRSAGFTHRKTTRRLLPVVGPPVMSGVKVTSNIYGGGDRVNDRRLFDSFLPTCFHLSRKHDIEGGVLRGHEIETEHGDQVVIIGGGWGISTVRAAWATGPEGSVQTYEASATVAEDIETVCALNDVSDRCDIVAASVEEPYQKWDDNSPQSDQIEPETLPECDVLELDCQGGELDILKRMEIRPRTIIAELHPHGYPSQSDDLFLLLDDRGYDIIHRWDHDGVPVTQETMGDLYRLTRDGGAPSNPEIRTPPVIVARRYDK